MTILTNPMQLFYKYCAILVEGCVLVLMTVQGAQFCDCLVVAFQPGVTALGALIDITHMYVCMIIGRSWIWIFIA